MAGRWQRRRKMARRRRIGRAGVAGGHGGAGGMPGVGGRARGAPRAGARPLALALRIGGAWRLRHLYVYETPEVCRPNERRACRAGFYNARRGATTYLLVSLLLRSRGNARRKIWPAILFAAALSSMTSS